MRRQHCQHSWDQVGLRGGRQEAGVGQAGVGPQEGGACVWLQQFLTGASSGQCCETPSTPPACCSPPATRWLRRGSDEQPCPAAAWRPRCRRCELRWHAGGGSSIICAAIQPPPHQKALPWASGLGPPPAPAARRRTHPAVPACRARRPHMACSLPPAGMDGVAMAALTSEFCCSQLAAAAALPQSPPPLPPPPPLPRPACSAAASAHHGGHPAQLASQQRRHLFTCLRWRPARRRAEAVGGVGLKPSCWPPCCTQTRGNI